MGHQIAAVLDRPNTVHKYLNWPRPPSSRWPSGELSDHKLTNSVRQTVGEPSGIHRRQDFAPSQGLETIETCPELLWQEYKGADPGGYGYSRFCDLYASEPDQNCTLRSSTTRRKVVRRLAGHHPVHDRTPARSQAPSSCALGFSSYTFGRSHLEQELPCWSARNPAFSITWFAMLVPDNQNGVANFATSRSEHTTATGGHYGVAFWRRGPKTATRRGRESVQVASAGCRRLRKPPSQLAEVTKPSPSCWSGSTTTFRKRKAPGPACSRLDQPPAPLPASVTRSAGASCR